MKSSGFEGFIEIESRKNRGHSLGQHGFAYSRRPHHKHVMPAGRGQRQSLNGFILAYDIREIEVLTLTLGRPRFAGGESSEISRRHIGTMKTAHLR
jgi:hypothetical protein